MCTFFMLSFPIKRRKRIQNYIKFVGKWNFESFKSVTVIQKENSNKFIPKKLKDVRFLY